MRASITQLLQRVLPKPARRRLRRLWIRSPLGRVRFGSLRRRSPFSRHFGFDRGQPIDRFYVERFLAEQQTDIRGRVLEFGDSNYTRRYGEDRVTHSDVVFPTADNPEATIVADLATGDRLPEEAFDCIICTQTMHLFFEPMSVARVLFAALRPGGVLLVTVPGITQISDSRWQENWYWSFTGYSARRLFAEIAGPENVAIGVHGNVLASTAQLYGLASEELTTSELVDHDPDYHLLITVRAKKAVR